MAAGVHDVGNEQRLVGRARRHLVHVVAVGQGHARRARSSRSASGRSTCRCRRPWSSSCRSPVAVRSTVTLRWVRASTAMLSAPGLPSMSEKVCFRPLSLSTSSTDLAVFGTATTIACPAGAVGSARAGPPSTDSVVDELRSFTVAAVAGRGRELECVQLLVRRRRPGAVAGAEATDLADVGDGDAAAERADDGGDRLVAGRLRCTVAGVDVGVGRRRVRARRGHRCRGRRLAVGALERQRRSARASGVAAAGADAGVSVTEPPDGRAGEARSSDRPCPGRRRRTAPGRTADRLVDVGLLAAGRIGRHREVAAGRGVLDPVALAHVVREVRLGAGIERLRWLARSTCPGR